MIKDVAFWKAWEREYERNHPLTVAQKVAILEGTYALARALRVFPPSDPEGIELKIRLAQTLDSLR